MTQETGLRHRKKQHMRQYIADTAARLFADHGFDEVSISDVAQAADVSDQTVYNYFPAKHDLVLDRAEEIRERYFQVIVKRPAGTSPAVALHALACEDIERYRQTDLQEARGEFPAICSSSSSIRRYALEVRALQIETVSAAITTTCPHIHPAVVRAHASSLISMFQMITDQIGQNVLTGTASAQVADELRTAVEAVTNDLDRHFQSIIQGGV
jgi:AcrR family transcriptional regulator